MTAVLPLTDVTDDAATQQQPPCEACTFVGRAPRPAAWRVWMVCGCVALTCDDCMRGTLATLKAFRDEMPPCRICRRLSGVSFTEPLR